MATSVLTFDEDWAPDWAVEMCIEMCTDAGVPFTFFVTHQSPVLESLADREDVELGVHPNFLPGSSHGGTVSDVLDTMLTLVPGAVSMRTHSLVQSSPLLAEVALAGQIRNDASLLLPFTPDLSVSSLCFDTASLTRLPYSWEDDEAMSRADWCWNAEEWPGSTTGLLAYDFHPIHVALNSQSMDQYRALKRHLRGRPLTDCAEEEAMEFRSRGRGTATYLVDLLRNSKGTWLSVAQACSGEE